MFLSALKRYLPSSTTSQNPNRAGESARFGFWDVVEEGAFKHNFAGRGFVLAYSHVTKTAVFQIAMRRGENQLQMFL